MSNSPTEKKKTPRIWHSQHEVVLKGWGESAACYRFMHYKAFQMYKKMNMRFTLPIIIIGTVTGTANFAQGTFPAAARPYVPSIIGAMNLFSAILTTIAQFLKVAELMESHRVSYINYGKLSRSIKLELTLPVSERTYHGGSMVDACGVQYDRLIEQSPTIPNSIINLFDGQFKDEEEKDPKNLKFVRPDILNIKPIQEYTIIETVIENIKKHATSKKRKPSVDQRQSIVDELHELNERGLVSVIVSSHSAAAHLEEGTFDDGNLENQVNNGNQQE